MQVKCFWKVATSPSGMSRKGKAFVGISFMATFHSSKLISSSHPSPANVPHKQE
jgi:hypothetical protein